MKTKTKQLCRSVIAVLCAAFMVLGTVISDVGAINAKAEEYRTEWDFEKDSSLNGENGVKIEGSTGTVAGLEIDATNGKWDSTVANSENPWVQVNKGTIIRVPLQGKSTVAVTGYNANYTVDGKAATIWTQGEENFTCEGTEGSAVIEVTGDSFSLKSIRVTPVTIRDDGEKMIDVWDFGAKTESDETMYRNNITPQAWLDKKIIGDGTNGTTKGEFIGSDGMVTFGDLTLKYTKGDKLYSNAAELSGINAGKSGNATYDYKDGYQAAGGWHTGGTGGDNRRYAVIQNVKAGDKIIAYVGNHSGSGGHKDTSFFFEYMGSDGVQKDAIDMTEKSFHKGVFIAQYSGEYKIWENNRCKPFFHRIVRIPSVKVTGTIEFGAYQGSGHTLKFINQETKQATDAVLDGSNFTAYLTAGYTYTALLSGVADFGFTDASKIVVTTDEESVTGKDGVKLVVEPQDTIHFSGKVTGFFEGYDVSELVITLTPPKDAYSDTIELKFNEDLSYNELIRPNVKYTLSLSGVNDYEITTPLSIEDSKDHTENITVATKPVHVVTGGFLDLDSAKVTSLKFQNVEDEYIYPAEVTDNGYRISLRDGAYLALAEVSDYRTITHVVVEGKAVSKDLLFVYTAEKAKIPWVSDIYVGYPEQEHNYDTMREAMEACDLMEVPGVENRGEKQRITVHIAPGTYREQIIVNAPYISLVNDTDQEVVLTWYYGIGYKYYSVGSDGLYDPEKAYDKYEKNGDPANWGHSVYVKETATAFRAEGITFENSFNRKVTEEELADGVEGITKPERNKNIDAQSKFYNERAAAIGINADRAEFKNCSFLSSQDTLYTGGKKLHLYFKDCLIEGQTDYIFGDGNCIFDACELRWKGYSDTDKGYGGYITAASPSAADTKGYLFRDCVITANDQLRVAAGYYGRPWGKLARVTFFNTKLERANLIEPDGWKSMSVEPEEAFFYEYNTTTLDGTAVDTSRRRGNVMTEAEAGQVNEADYFEGWIPYYYEGELKEVGFATKPFITDDGDIEAPCPGDTLTVGYTLSDVQEADDASVIEWYRVKEGKETLVKESDASDKTYQITTDDSGCNLKAVVTPATVDGRIGTAESCMVEAVVAEGDPEVPDRVAGYSRYETALKSADIFKKLKGIDQFDAVVIAAGGAFPDALAGSTLAAAKNAPILLAGGSMNDDTNATLDYVKKNVKAGGEVYILGGTAAVSEEAEQQLKTDGYQVTRIAGTNRYETNLKLLENLDTPEGTDVIIASGSNYPDSIAVSGIAGAKGMPIILTSATLNDEAVEKIKEIKPEHIYLIGGTSAVPEAVESQLQGLGQIQRIAGMNRYATSLEIAKAFGLQNAGAAVIAYGNNFPDGLTGSVIAAELNAPIILVTDSSYQEQAEFIQNSKIKKFYVLGGTGVISDDTIGALLGL